MSQQFPAVGTDVRELSAEEFKRRLDAGEQFTLLDTRRPADFEEWQLTHPNLTAVNVPFTAFLDEEGNPASDVPEGVPDGPLVTCCAKGISSLYVAKFLAREGWDVLALDDGMEGWAQLTEIFTVASGAGTELLQFHRPSSGCLSYLLVADDEAAVVDPLRVFAAEYRRAASERGATLEYAIDTHVHADHISGVRELAGDDDLTAIFPAGATDRGLSFDAKLVGDGEELALGSTTIQAVALPGHTTEMTGYRFEDVLLCGDSLFLESVARPDLEDEARAREAAGRLWETLASLESLDPSLLVAPGHASTPTGQGPDGSFTATLGTLRDRLPAFEMDREEFVTATTTNLPPRPANYEQIIAVNLGRQQADDETAFELELGPNHCATDG